jgi:hypothetical protein
MVCFLLAYLSQVQSKNKIDVPINLLREGSNPGLIERSQVTFTFLDMMKQDLFFL